jgi:hypothetical protein
MRKIRLMLPGSGIPKALTPKTYPIPNINKTHKPTKTGEWTGKTSLRP